MEQRPIITVCDDLPDQAKEWLEGLEELDGVAGVFDVRRLEKTDFQQGIGVLEARRTSLRNTGELPSSDEQTIFDDTDVLIVDFDLFEFEPANQRLTGEEVAYLARCYSSCGFIVGVNLDKVMNPFDLSLSDHPESFVDLAVGGSQVALPALWSGGETTSEEVFHPSYWPLVPERTAFLRSRAASLEERMDDPIEQLLELPDHALQVLTRTRRNALEIPEAPEQSLSGPARRWLTHSVMGIDRKDRLAGQEAEARVLAARLLKWFEIVVLPGQDLLVDAPHLIERRPGLLNGDSADADLWGRTCRFDLPASELPLRHELLSNFVWDSEWVCRPVWLWPSLSVDQSIEATRQAPRPQPRAVFAEDVSSFVSKEQATRFQAKLDSPFSARWVAQPRGQEIVQYIPSSLLAAD
jgi:hypothetical protein